MTRPDVVTRFLAGESLESLARRALRRRGNDPALLYSEQLALALAGVEEALRAWLRERAGEPDEPSAIETALRKALDDARSDPTRYGRRRGAGADRPATMFPEIR